MTRRKPRSKTYVLDGIEGTVYAIKRRGLVYREEAIREALEAGCTTTPELIAHIETAVASSRAARRQGASVPFYGRGKDDALET